MHQYKAALRTSNKRWASMSTAKETSERTARQSQKKIEIKADMHQILANMTQQQCCIAPTNDASACQSIAWRIQSGSMLQGLKHVQPSILSLRKAEHDNSPGPSAPAVGLKACARGERGRGGGGVGVSFCEPDADGLWQLMKFSKWSDL